MKKILISLIIVLFSLSLFAKTPASELIKKDLLNSKLNIVGVSSNIGFYHASQLMASEAGAKAIVETMKGNFSAESTNLAMILLRNLSSGNDSIVDASFGFGASVKNYGISFDSYVGVNTYAEDSVSIATLNIVPTAKTSLSFMYAKKIIKSEDFFIDAKLTGHINSIVLNDSISYSSFKDETGISLNGYAGVGLPIDIQADVVINNGIKCYLAVDNIAATYFLDEYKSSDQIFSKAINLGNGKKYREDVNLKTGISYELGNSWFNAEFFGDINKINSLFDGDFSSNFKKNVNLGARLDLNDIASLELGIFGGYLGSSLSVGYNNNRFNLSYGWKESGNSYGEAPVDYLDIGVSFGWKK